MSKSIQTNEKPSTVGVKLRDVHANNSPAAPHLHRATCNLDPENFMRMMSVWGVDSNPRKPKETSVARDIQDTLKNNPALFDYMSKGVLIGVSRIKPAERGRVQLDFSRTDYAVAGIMDGGHNAFAIAKHMLSFVAPNSVLRKIRDWDTLVTAWAEYRDEVAGVIRDIPEFTVPMEIIAPSNPDDPEILRKWGESLRDITHARNNNAQLTDATKDNHVGMYDYLKEVLPEDLVAKVTWKTNDGGVIKVEDVVALALIPLAVLPQEITGVEISLPSIYNSKVYCVDTFSRIMKYGENGKWNGQKFELQSQAIKSALAMVPDLITAHDTIYTRFPEWYNQDAGGAFGSIKGVRLHNPKGAAEDRKKYSKTPFESKFLDLPCDYLYGEGFILPLVVGLRKLMSFSARSKKMTWKITPLEFMETQHGKVMGMYGFTLRQAAFNPQVIGKDKGTYNIVDNAIEMCLALMPSKAA